MYHYMHAYMYAMRGTYMHNQKVCIPMFGDSEAAAIHEINLPSNWRRHLFSRLCGDGRWFSHLGLNAPDTDPDL